MSDVLSIAHYDVNEVYQSAFTPLESIKVYLFTSSGAYQGINATTDFQGQVIFSLPAQDYKVRADYLGSQYWSEVFNSQNTAIDIGHGYASIHVTETGTDIYDAPVYLFTETGSYLGRVIRTDSAGMARFLIPAKAYKFRVDYNGTQYWSDVVNVLTNEETTVDLQLDLLAMNLTNDPNPVRFDGKPPEFKPEPLLLASLFDISGILSQSVVTVVTPIYDEKIYYYINDHLGTPQRIIDETGAVVWNADYQPFGEADVNPNSTVVNNFRLPGQYWDRETGLHYNFHRYYNPEVGRYLRADPIGLDGGINLYNYVLNDPTNFIDPYGLFKSHWLLRTFVPGQVAWDNALTSLENDNYIGFGLNSAAMVGEQVLTVLTLGESKTAQQCASNLSSKTGQFSDWFRKGPTIVSKQLVEGPGAKGAVRTWGIKGGGTNPNTGFKLSFHYHIHKYNWNKPWKWFRQTPIIK
ncbi:MAG: RHS repeat-associated core domain-containing protein [Pseudomonadota bacterium]